MFKALAHLTAVFLFALPGGARAESVHFELDGKAPVSDWTVSAKVTKLLARGFEFEALFFESSDVLHPDLSGKQGVFRTGFAEKAEFEHAVGDEVTFHIQAGKEPCKEMGMSIERDEKLLFGWYRRYQDVPNGIKILPDAGSSKTSLRVDPDENKEELLEKNASGSVYRLPVKVSLEPGGQAETIPVADIGKKSTGIAGAEGKYRVFAVESSRLEAVGASKCKAFTVEVVIWAEGKVK